MNDLTPNVSYNMLNRRIHINHAFSCSIEFLGSVVYNDGDVGLIHKYPYWAYSYIENNPGVFYFENVAIEVPAGNGIFIPPNVEHYLKCDGPKKMSLIYLGVTGIDFPDYDNVFSFYEKHCNTSCMKNLNAALSKALLSMRISNSPDTLSSFSHLILEKLLNVNNFINANSYLNNSSVYSKKNLISSASSILCEDFSKNISLKELSERLYVSEKTLANSFSEITNLRFKEYYSSLKMEYALHLLKTTDVSISQISEILGFCDTQYFSKKFKQHFEQTPYSVRKESLEE